MIKYHCYKCKRELSNLNSKCECSNNPGILVIDDEKFYVNKHTKEARAGWQWRGYYGTLESALKGILSKQLLDSIDDEITLKEVLDKIEQVRQEIKNAKITDLEED